MQDCFQKKFLLDLNMYVIFQKPISAYLYLLIMEVYSGIWN